MFDEPMIARFVAPNLTAAVRKYSDAELAVIIRNGVRPGGRSMVVMPSEAFVLLTDEDVGRIIAFLRSLPAVDGPGPSLSLGPLGRVGLATGKFKLVAQLIAETVPPPEATSKEATYGRYLARTTCAQCHGTSLRGASNPAFTSPTLQVAAAYSREEFAELLRTGVPLGGRKLGEMGVWARNNLSHLTDAEIAALYFQRYKDCGLEGLTDRSRRPYRQANQLPLQIEKLIVRLKRDKPSWGAPKIREMLRRQHSEIPTPAISTVHAVLDRHGLVKHGRKRRRYKACGTPLAAAHAPNGLWCADYKGEFPARQPAVLLPAHHHRLPLAATCSPAKASSRRSRSVAFSVFERAFPRLRPARRDPHRQRHAVRRRPGLCSARPRLLRLVAALRHPTAAHQARQPAAERTS